MEDSDESGYFFFQSPWKNIFLWHFLEVEKEALLVTPTLSIDVLRKMQSMVISRGTERLKVKLLLRFSECDFLTKDIDPEILRILAVLKEEPSSGFEIRFVPNLSATTIIFDRKKAIISTGDLSQKNLASDITYGILITGKDVVSGVYDDMEALWESASTSGEELKVYLDDIRKRLSLRAETQITDPEGDLGFKDTDLLSLGDIVELKGVDRSEPHLDEVRKILKELLIRARDAVSIDNPTAALFYIDEGLTLTPDNPDLLLERGKILYQEKKDLKEALKCFEKVLDQNEDSRDAWAFMGYCLHELGELDDALYAYDQATDIDPSYYPAWIKKGIILGKTAGREEDGLKCLEYALGKDSYNEEAWFNKAVILEQKLGRMEEAILSYRSLLRINPKHTKGAFRMGLLLYKKLDDPEKAVKYFDKVTEADPGHIQAWLFKGEISENIQKDLNRALECYENAREGSDDSPDVLHKEIELLLRHKKKFKLAVELSNILVEERPDDPIGLYVAGLGAVRIDSDPDRSLELFNESLKSDHSNKMVIISKANLLAEYLNRTQDAVKILQAALQRSPEDPELWMELGLIYFDFLYEPTEAIKCFDKVTQLDKANADGWYNKGLILSRGFEKHTDALKCLDEVTRLDDEYALAWYEKGRILSTVYNLTNDALKCYNKSLSIEPEDPEVITAVANAYLAKNNIAKAITNFKEAVEVDPEFIDAHLGLANTLFKAGDFKGVHESLTGALQADPKSEKSWMLKAETFRAQKMPGKAFECYKRVLRVNPDNQDALNKKTAVEAQLERTGS